VTSSREAQQDYFDHYGKIDIWTPPAHEAQPFTLMRSQERVSDDAVLNSEFYQDYARHLDMWHPMGVNCMLAPGQVLTAGVNRNRSGRVFSDEEEAQLVELMRHIQRALQMRRRFQGVEVRAQAGFAALDALAFAAVVVDAGGCVAFANAKAEELDRSGAGLTLGGGRIGCAVPRQARDFADLIRTAASGGVGGAMRITDRSGETALLALVAPMPSRLSDSQNGDGLALVALRRERDNPAFAETIVSQLLD